MYSSNHKYRLSALVFNKTLWVSLFLILFSSCEKEDAPTTVHKRETISGLLFKAVNIADPSDTVELFYEDLDGEGGIAPTIRVSNAFTASSIYQSDLQYFYRVGTRYEDRTAEIRNEAKFHQVFYSTDLDMNFPYLDEDENEKPLGLKVQISTGSASMGSLEILLIHEPNKSASGVSSGISTNAGGKTDFIAVFEVRVE